MTVVFQNKTLLIIETQHFQALVDNGLETVVIRINSNFLIVTLAIILTKKREILLPYRNIAQKEKEKKR